MHKAFTLTDTSTAVLRLISCSPPPRQERKESAGAGKERQATSSQGSGERHPGSVPSPQVSPSTPHMGELPTLTSGAPLLFLQAKTSLRASELLFTACANSCSMPLRDLAASRILQGGEGNGLSATEVAKPMAR